MEYKNKDIDKLVNEWIDFQHKMEKAESYEEEDEIEMYDIELMDSILENNPELGISIILKILEKDKTGELYPVLAADLLEDLLSYNGNIIIDDIQKLAEKNLKFKKLLGGVWQGEMSKDLYAKIVDIAGGQTAKW